MIDRDARVGNIKTLINLLADIEQELEAADLQGEAFLAKLRELRQQCHLELTLIEKQREELPQDND